MDKHNLSDKVELFDNEKDGLIKYQQSFFEHLQQQQKDIEELNRQNNELKNQLTNERAKLIGICFNFIKSILIAINLNRKKCRSREANRSNKSDANSSIPNEC